MLEKVRSGRESMSRAQARVAGIGARLAKMQQQEGGRHSFAVWVQGKHLFGNCSLGYIVYERKK